MARASSSDRTIGSRSCNPEVKAQSELTFGQCADKLFADLSVDWRHPKHKQQWTNSLRNHAAALRDLPIAAIETKDVLAVVEPIWRAKANTAHRVRSRIETVLDWPRRGAIARATIPPAGAAI